MNSTLIKLYGFFAGLSLLAFLVTGQGAEAAAGTAALDQRTQERAINLAANMTNRLEATLERFANIIERTKINQRRKEGRDFDLTAVTTKLQTASDLVSDSQTLLSTIDQQVYGAMTANDPLVKWLPVKNSYQTVELNIPLIHQNILEAIVILEQANNSWLNNQTASSSSTSAPVKPLTASTTTNSAL